jgi:hypothetical protein
VPRPQPKFGHAATATVRAAHGEVVLLGCYHPSQQNTFTGKLTPRCSTTSSPGRRSWEVFDEVGSGFLSKRDHLGG